MNTLKRANGNQSEAARLLGISRTSVWNQIKKTLAGEAMPAPFIVN
ncbi:MAG: helix-turn-helix domain-containing protein [Desulfosarcina sp.]|nr:helix-turn-helix domain-containing protein [Desulfosarcina sp.]